MDQQETLTLLTQIRDGAVSPADALLRLRAAPFEDLRYAKPDHHRGLRRGVPEVIYGAGKSPEQIAGIASAMRDSGQKTVIITRLSREAAESVNKSLPITYYADARIGLAGKIPAPDGMGKILLATGGTSDIPVAEEAAVTAEALGNEVVRLYDAGVAGLHRLLSRLNDIMGARVIIAIAGMEGALASVIGGLADCPVIGVPTSVGYGASFGGVSALLSMLNSCASGVSVVNIDNGFGAGYLASLINHAKNSNCNGNNATGANHP
jgi:NCAIR mutase (PurE)-related protein